MDRAEVPPVLEFFLADRREMTVLAAADEQHKRLRFRARCGRNLFEKKRDGFDGHALTDTTTTPQDWRALQSLPRHGVRARVTICTGAFARVHSRSLCAGERELDAGNARSLR